MSDSDTPLTDEWEQRYGRARHWTEFAKRLERRLRALERPGVWVPRDPTDKMLMCFGHEWITGQAYECYKAMLLAAREER